MNKEYKIDFNKRIYDRLNLPVVDVIVIDKYYSFLLDTGSNINVIDKDFFEILKKEKGLEQKEKSTIVGGVMNDKTVDSVDLELIVKDQQSTFSFQILDLSNIRNKVRLHANSEIEGILGNVFFEHFKWILDFKELVVCK